ncbi:AMP-binding protein [Chitinimonas lacunae]|uniref:AMP-binding protein n=1 Tax=Chitinimonas lacunae TaxID=1963018 RepID=A0ABV8MU30_9NEIS
MAELLRLDSLLSLGRPPGWPVAWRDGQWLSFADFSGRAAAWQQAFAASPGRDWALYLHDSFDFAAALFGAWHAGKRVYLPADVLPATVARLAGQVDGFAGDLPHTQQPLRPLAPSRPTRWSSLDRQAQALVVYTSGSSGEPVAIPKRLGQLFDEVETLAACWEGELDGAPVLATVSHQHIYGLLFRLLWPLAAGRPFDAGRLAFPEDIVAALAARGPAVLVASPAHLKRLPRTLPWQTARPGLRALFSSGGPLSDEALADCRELLGQAPVEVYGSSETGGVAWRRRDQPAAALWRALPRVELSCEDGALRVHSPYQGGGDGFLTADRVRLGADGFELLGRADRIVKIEEKRVSLGALERLLLDSGLVEEARVVALPGPRLTLGVVAVPSAAGWRCYDESGKRGLNGRLRAALAGAVEPSALPRRWRYGWALPLDSQGKTKESDLIARFDPRRPSARLQARSEESALLDIDVAATSPFFDGHFPATPILPGVTQLEWAVLFGRELFELPADFLRLEAVKFQQVIPPGTLLQLELGWQAARTTLSFRFSSAAGQHASGRIVFGGPA